MSPACNGSTALQRFKRGNAIAIHNRIMFDFYPGLPHMYIHISIHHTSASKVASTLFTVVHVCLFLYNFLTVEVLWAKDDKTG